MSEPKYTMLLAEEVPDYGPDWWIFYPEGGNYIHDELMRMPAGSKIQEQQARKVLEALNK